MPEPTPGEPRKQFVDRCISVVIRDGTTDNPTQAVAICNSIWERAQKRRDNAEHPGNSGKD